MSERLIKRLVLVYAADSTLPALLADVAKKFAGVPGCTLCDVTHGPLGERSEWRACRAELGLPIDVFHRDDVPREVRAVMNDEWPAVLARTARGLVQLVDARAIARLGSSPAALRDEIVSAMQREGLEMPSRGPAVSYA